MLEQVIVIIHVLAAIAVVALILLQQGKGADMGASFGSGASQTVLGVQGGGNFLTHSTAILVTVFFLTSLSLAYYAKQKSMVDVDDIVIEQTQDARDEVPASTTATAPEASAPATSTVETVASPAVENAVVTPEVPVEAPAAQAPATEIPE